MYEVKLDENSKLAFSRQRVIEFESELSERILKQEKTEKSIIEVGKLRRLWFESLSKVDELDTTIFKKRIEVSKKKAEVLYIELAIDLIQLEGLQEGLTLNYLVEATKTLGINETPEDRSRELSELLKSNADTWKAALSRSVALRNDLCLRCDRQSNECDQIRVDFDVQSQMLIAELQKRVKTYFEHLKAAAADSKDIHTRVTKEYLVMRHNAKVAQEILLRKQQEANAARNVLKAKLDSLVMDAAQKREHLSKAAASELKILSEDIRAEVKNREAAVMEVQSNITHHKVERKEMRKKLYNTHKLYEQKYKELEMRRVSEVTQIEEELNNLRELIGEMQLKLTVAQSSPSKEDYELLQTLRRRMRKMQQVAK